MLHIFINTFNGINSNNSLLWCSYISGEEHVKVQCRLPGRYGIDLTRSINQVLHVDKDVKQLFSYI